MCLKSTLLEMLEPAHPLFLVELKIRGGNSAASVSIRYSRRGGLTAIVVSSIAR